MLQQTQVSRVLGYYARFLETFPTLSDVARAKLRVVIRHTARDELEQQIVCRVVPSVRDVAARRLERRVAASRIALREVTRGVRLHRPRIGVLGGLFAIHSAERDRLGIAHRITIRRPRIRRRTGGFDRHRLGRWRGCGGRLGGDRRRIAPRGLRRKRRPGSRLRAAERGAHQIGAVLCTGGPFLLCHESRSPSGLGRGRRRGRRFCDVDPERAGDLHELARMRDPFERELRFHVRALSRAEEDCGLDVAHEFGGRGVLIVRERQRGRETTMRGEVLGVERRRIAIQADRRGRQMPHQFFHGRTFV